MAIKLNNTAQLSQYKGVLGWNTYTAGDGTVYPDIEIPLFIKDHPIPVRRPKVTEINTVDTRDPGSGAMINANAVFFGSPDLLSINISGWLITPITSSSWTPLSKAGAPLGLGNITYGELISAFIEGRMNKSSVGSWKRKDPDYYVSPYGHNYANPIISIWDPQYSTVRVKQPFTMTLLLEK